jgi:hypothetical protein
MELDDQVMKLFSLLEKKKEEFNECEAESKKKWVTNCSFPSVYGNTAPINIQTQTESALVELLSDLLTQDGNSRKAAELIGANYPNEGTWGGFSVDQWVDDFKTRIAKIRLVERKQELVQLEKRLNGVVSPEQRRKLEIEAITQSLGSMD